jgi:ADP-L-glycero-D-manno-heptose 6-epimerase
MLFDQYVEDFIGKSATQIVGLRYFNVYGPWEYRKGRMASVMNQFHNQIKDNSHIKIFENSENYLRDFIYVEDVVNVNLHFAQNKQLSGIFNCGTGVPRAFADIPKALSAHYKFEVEEVKMPTALEGKYQTFTQANLNKLVHTGQYRNPFLSLEEGIGKYVDFWSK